MARFESTRALIGDTPLVKLNYLDLPEGVKPSSVQYTKKAYTYKGLRLTGAPSCYTPHTEALR